MEEIGKEKTKKKYIYNCVHGKCKYSCGECRMYNCVHGKSKYSCGKCGMYNCVHGKRKCRCKECCGSGICEHGREKYICKECGGLGICEHGKQKINCNECGGSGICEHGKQKSQCKKCKGSSICEHEKPKSQCKECDGSSLCKNCKDVRGISKYDGYCLRCTMYLFPDTQVFRNYKTKETAVRDYVLKNFPDLNWISDKRIYDGCSKRRPDLLLDLGYQAVIIEVDEYKHNSYECSCENKRIMEISQDLGHRPVVFIRFNPDSYVNMDGKKIKTCWTGSKKGILRVTKVNKKMWQNRLDCLKNQIKYWVDPKNKTDKMIETIQLYYDDFNDS